MTLPIDIDAVREQLTAADEQIEKLQRFRDWLREGLELAGETPAAQQVLPAAATEEPPAPPRDTIRQAAPPKPPATTSGRDGLNERQQQVLTALNSLQSATKKEIAAAVEFDPTDQLRTLIRRGLATATGTTKDRRFHSVTRQEHREHRAAIDHGTAVSQRKIDDGVLRVKVLDEIRRNQGQLTAPARGSRRCCSTPTASPQAVQQLAAAGKVIATGGGTLTALTEQELRRRRAAAA